MVTDFPYEYMQLVCLDEKQQNFANLLYTGPVVFEKVLKKAFSNFMSEYIALSIPTVLKEADGNSWNIRIIQTVISSE